MKENTVAAVVAAFKDYDGCEFDVRLTKDGELVLHHNSRYKGRPVWELDRHALRGVDAFEDLLSDERIVGGVNEDGKTLWIELKEGSRRGFGRDDGYIKETAEAVKGALKDSGLEKNNIRLISFQPLLLKPIRGFKRLPIVPFTYGAYDSGIKHRTLRTYVHILTPLRGHIERAKEQGFAGILFSNRFFKAPFSINQPSVKRLRDIAGPEFILGTEAKSREEEVALKEFVVITDFRGARKGKGPKTLVCHRGL